MVANSPLACCICICFCARSDDNEFTLFAAADAPKERVLDPNGPLEPLLSRGVVLGLLVAGALEGKAATMVVSIEFDCLIICCAVPNVLRVLGPRLESTTDCEGLCPDLPSILKGVDGTGVPIPKEADWALSALPVLPKPETNELPAAGTEVIAFIPEFVTPLPLNLKLKGEVLGASSDPSEPFITRLWSPAALLVELDRFIPAFEEGSDFVSCPSTLDVMARSC
jgi:hypothetical protein